MVEGESWVQTKRHINGSGTLNITQKYETENYLENTEFLATTIGIYTLGRMAFVRFVENKTIYIVERQGFSE